MPQLFGSFLQTLEFGFNAQGLQDTCHQWLIIRIYLKVKTRRFKTNLTLSLILRFNQRLGGYSIWSVSFIAPHIKEDYWRHKHLTTSRQPRKYLEDTFKTKFRRTQRHL
jgi:hypothetical protein